MKKNSVDYSLTIYNEEYYEPVHLTAIMKESFLLRYNRSSDKGELIRKEIRDCEVVFDNELLPLSRTNLHGRFPLGNSHIIMNDRHIFFMREAYFIFIVEGKEISTASGFLESFNPPWTLLELNITLNFAKSLKEYSKWLQNALNEKIYIIEEEYLGLIYNKFREYLQNESKEHWKRRFHFPSPTSIENIQVSKVAKEGSDTLNLLGILSAMEELTKNKFPFDKFVLERFGIRNFFKKVSDHSIKETFIKAKKDCEAILKK